MVEHFDDRGFDIRKSFAVMIVGAPGMVVKQKGAVILTEEKAIHPVMKLHCRIHQEHLCVKFRS